MYGINYSSRNGMYIDIHVYMKSVPNMYLITCVFEIHIQMYRCIKSSSNHILKLIVYFKSRCLFDFFYNNIIIFSRNNNFCKCISYFFCH